MPVPYSDLTQAQRDALDRLWERDEDTVSSNLEYEEVSGEKLPAAYTRPYWLHKVAQRLSVQPGAGCVMIEWRGMWLGIEPDGYTHS